MGRSARLISVVVPACNEEATIPALYEQTRSVLEGLGLDWELVLVDDGSTDRTRELVHELHERDSRVKAILFSRNFGQDAALTAGLYAARGDVAVLMDADLQDPPEVIEAMIEKWQQGYDIVGGRRRRREGESVVKRATSFLWYRVMNVLAGGGFPKDTGDFRLMDHSVVEAFRQYNQYNRFVRSLIDSTGFRRTQVDYDRPARLAGETKYSLRKSFGLAATSIVHSTVAPLRLALWVGLIIMFLSVIGIAHWVRVGLAGNTGGWASLVISVWFLGGIQCVLIGIVGEYVGRTYIESQRRPIYIVQESLGLEEESDSTTAKSG